MSKDIKTFCFHFFAILLVLVAMLPFFWMISTSFKPNGALMAIPVQWIPKEPTFQNYFDIFQRESILRSMFNSLVVAIGFVCVTLISAAMAGFAFAKIEFKGREILFMIFLASMMIPYQVLFIPTYLIMSRLHLSNNLISLILPGFFKAFAVFMFRQQMKALPDAYIEAAAIDGSNIFMTFIRIVCPMCKTVFVTLFIILFMDSWNDYLMPLVMLSTKDKFTLPIILNSMTGQYKNEYNLLMAGALVSIFPILILYGLAQKQFASGLQVGGIKG